MRGALHRLAMACIAPMLAACGTGGAQDAQPRPPMELRYDERTGRLQEVTYDRDADGAPDAWLFMDGAALLRAEMDEDRDGIVDRWEHYASAGRPPVDEGDPPSAAPVLVELSDRADGAVTRRERYAAGVLVGVESDTNGDGRFDKWETYVDGTLRRLELARGDDARADPDAARRPTKRLLYGPGGALVRLEADADGDGVFEAVAIDETPVAQR